MSRILVLYASVGTGHKAAATALAEAFSADPANQVRVEDTLDYASATFRWLYRQTYLGVTNYAPRLATMAARARHAGRPQAAQDIAAFVAQSGRS